MKKTLTAAVIFVFFSLTCLILPVLAERSDEPLVANNFIKETPVNTTLNFTISDFTESVNPPEGGGLVSITITQLPNETAGTLRLSADPVALDASIQTEALDQLNFVPAKDYEGEAIFTWNANYGTATSPFPSAVTIRIGDIEGATEEPTESPAASVSPTPEPVPTLKPLQYEDMLEHWGAFSAGILGAEGIIIGEEIGGHFYFYPDKVLTRIDFIILANSVFGIKTKDSLEGNPFADTDVPAFMLRQAIAAYENGLIAGSADGEAIYLNPFDRLTRAEAAKILDNALKLEYVANDEVPFADSDDIPGWAMQAVQNMESYGIVKGYDDNTFRPYTNISKAQAGELLFQIFKYREKTYKSKSVFNEVFYGTL